MRINFVMPAVTLAGGVRVVAIYAEELVRRGHQVEVVSVPRPMCWKRRIKQVLRGKGYSATLPPMDSHFDGKPIHHRVLNAYRPVEDRDLPDADVTVATWWKTAYWVNKLGPTKGAKLYFIQHDERHVGGTAEQVLPTWSMPMYKVLVAQWLVPLIREHGVEHELAVVPNAVDLSQFHAPPRGKQERPTVGVMYSDAAFKGCDIAIKAFEMARQRFPELQLIAFGKDGAYEQMPLPEGTRYLRNPPQDQIKEVYSACDAWLFASRCEGFGLPILEAMACRTPVIGTPVGAAPELIGQGGGFLVNPADPASMAEAIEKVIGQSESDWRAMSDQALATAAGYSWTQAADAFEAALRRAIELNGNPGEAQSVRGVEPGIPFDDRLVNHDASTAFASAGLNDGDSHG